MSEERLKPLLHKHGLRPSNYEGPASIVTYMTVLARQKGLEMATLVAEIPPYVEGRNVKCIEAATRKLAAILDLQVDLDDMRVRSEKFETSLNATLEDRPELANQIRQMESAYDKEEFDTEMADLKEWLERQGIRMD